MLHLTQSPFNLVKYHLSKDNPDAHQIIIKRTDSLQEVKDLLLEGVAYDEEGELVPSSYLIYYTGVSVIKDLKIHTHNTTHLVVTQISKWKHLKKNKNVKFFEVKPSQYAYTIQGVEAILTKDAQRHFWSQYCIGKFNSNPYKWYNEVRYLFAIYQTSRKKFNVNDLDCLYNSVSDSIKPYLKNIFTPKGKEYILQMTNKELFVIFIGGGNRRALIENYIKKVKPEFLYIYMIFVEAFRAGHIRLLDGVIILDYLLNKENIRELNEVCNLFGI